MKSAARGSLVCLLLIVVAVGWFAIASDYGDSVAVGTYHLRQGGESSNLILKADHTFQQNVTHNGVTQRCEGEWRRIGEGGLAFSKQFLPVIGQELGSRRNPVWTNTGDVWPFPIHNSRSVSRALVRQN